MDPSLTEQEKRCVLAEIIKHSKVDLNNIAAFIRANHVEPDWLNMHLPYGN